MMSSLKRSHANAPIRMMTVVDGMIGPKGANPLQLFVGGRCRDDGCSRRLGNLQRKDGNAAGAEHENPVTGLQCAIDDQGPPCGHASRGKCRSLGE